MQQVRFVAELSYLHDWPPNLFLPATINTNKGGDIICTLQTARPTSSYWLDWGGHYDTPETSQLILFFDGFLTKVDSVGELLRIDKSYYVSGTTIYIHLLRYPWTYPPEHAQTLAIKGYASAVSNPARPSDDTYMVNSRRVHYPVRLAIPSVENRLSDVVSGIRLYKTFKLRLINKDGHFDGSEDAKLFNTPLRLRKSVADAPGLDDYKTIRYGFVEEIDVTDAEMQIEVADINRTLNDELCRTITEREFPGADQKLHGKPLPVAWGPIKRAKLIKIGDRQYVPCDPAYISFVSGVYDKDGKPISTTLFSLVGGIIELSSFVSERYFVPHTCDFVGKARNRVGEIIADVIADKSLISYTEGNWDVAEADRYINASPPIGILARKGKVKDLIVACLRNDSAFLIGKNDGRLTLRGWGLDYATHTIRAWQLTKTPRKIHREKKFYASSILVHYDYQYNTKEHTRSYLLDQDEEKIYGEWHHRQRQEYETHLIDDEKAEQFANTLLDRFRRRREICQVAVGYDTSEINPLDEIELTLTYNGRRFSPHTSWRVLEANPAQDILKIEART